MPIRAFFKGGTAFDSDTIQAMSAALAGVLDALGLKDTKDELAFTVAKKIIELAMAGELDTERLKAETLRSIRQ